MKSIYLDTLAFLSDSLHDRKSTHVNSSNWSDIFAELQAHAVTSLVAKNIMNIGLSSEDKLKFMQILGLSFRNYNNILLEQNKLLASLQEAGINAAVLKGTSAAKYYPNPEYRAMGDIDILVNPDDFDESHRVVELLGFVPVPEEDKYSRHIGFHNASGIEVELHRYFSSVGAKHQRDYLDKRLYAALDSCENNVFPAVENGLVLIGHIAPHLKKGLGLRQIIDWMMYVENNLTDEFWNENFSIPVKECGFEKLAKVTTAVCRKYLGLSIDVSWCNDVDETLVDTFAEYIMNQGNFGRKQNSTERMATTVINDFRNPIALFKYLQAGGKMHWKQSRNNRFLGCFAWIYQIGHIIRMGFDRRIGFKRLKHINNESKNIVKLMDELEITDY